MWSIFPHSNVLWIWFDCEAKARNVAFCKVVLKGKPFLYPTEVQKECVFMPLNVKPADEHPILFIIIIRQKGWIFDTVILSPHVKDRIFDDIIFSPQRRGQYFMVQYSHPRRGVNVWYYKVLTQGRGANIWYYNILSPSKEMKIWCHNIFTPM